MKKMLGILIGISALFYFAGISFAGPEVVNLCPNDDGTGNNFGALCNFSPVATLPRIITFILVLAVILALFFLIWGGIKWITSGGDKGKVEAARGTIIAAIIGLIVTFLAWFIINFVLAAFLGREAGGNFTLPNISDTGAGGGETNPAPTKKPRARTCGGLSKGQCTRSSVCSWNPTGNFCETNK